MINRRSIWLIFLRETRDQLRDRRMLFLVVVLPVLLYPALVLTMTQLMMQRVESPRHVVLLGADQLPADPPLIEGDHFSERWFRRATDPEGKNSPAAAKKLMVITDRPQSVGDATLLRNEGDPSINRPRLVEQAQAFVKQHQASPESAAHQFSSAGLQAVVVIPEDFGNRLVRARRQLAGTSDRDPTAFDYPRPKIYYSQADEKSAAAYERVVGVFDKWEKAILADWLQSAHIDQNAITPVQARPTNVALPEQVGASIWSKILPLLLIMMTAVGAFNPAVDLVAGEKERGTIETLLISPATRTEIVLGKFMTVMLFSGVTALLNLSSFGFTGNYIASQFSTVGPSPLSQLSFPSLASLGWVLLVLIPLAALFSALSLAFATFARSSKEGQYYLTPLLMVTVGLTMFCLFPNVEISPQYSVLPIVGPSLLLKSLLLGPGQSSSTTMYIFPVLLLSFGYGALALWWAVDQFNREDILFRAGERFELRLWLRQLFRDKQPRPSFGAAWTCFFAILFLQFFAADHLLKLFGIDSKIDSHSTYKLLLVQQLLFMGGPALLLTGLLVSNVRETLRLRLPETTMFAAGCLLPILMHPLVIELQASLHWFFGELPESLTEFLKPLSDDSIPLALAIFVIAVVPAVCEEIAFRGFILSGLTGHGRTLLAIALSSAAFGIMHMIPQQVFNAALVGLVLGALAIRSHSLVPCIAFHLVNNALAVLHGRYGGKLSGNGWLSLFVSIEESNLRYQWPTLLICGTLAAAVIIWLFRPLLKPTSPSSMGEPVS